MRIRNRTVVQAAVLLLILASCTQGPGPFDSYVGVNLIAVPALAFSASGKWVLDDTTGVYMGFEAVTGTGYEPPAAYPSAEVYRLEIKNLFPNGDFSQTATGSTPGGWTVHDGAPVGNPPPTYVVESVLLKNTAGDVLMSGNVLHLTAPYSSNYARLLLRDAAYGMRDGWVTNASYLPRFKYLTTNAGLTTEYGADEMLCYVNTWRVGGGATGADAPLGSPFQSLNAFPTAALLTETFPSIHVETETNPSFVLGSLDTAFGRAQEAYIDDFRIVRIDKPFHLRIEVAAQGLAALDLVPGSYRFSVYVKRDPSVGTPTGSNRLHATGVGLTVKRKNADGTFTVSAVQAFDDPDLALWKEWTILSVDLPNQSQDPDLATTTMELTVTPTDDSNAVNPPDPNAAAVKTDCGSILLSTPWLELYPNRL